MPEESAPAERERERKIGRDRSCRATVQGKHAESTQRERAKKTQRERAERAHIEDEGARRERERERESERERERALANQSAEREGAQRERERIRRERERETERERAQRQRERVQRTSPASFLELDPLGRSWGPTEGRCANDAASGSATRGWNVQPCTFQSRSS